MKSEMNKFFMWILDLSINIVVIFILVLAIQKWLIAPFDVSGASMCNTLNFIENECQTGKGEKIIIEHLSYNFTDPKRGDVVVFKPEKESEKYFIKRIIGLPGETIKILDGRVYIENEDGLFELIEPYLNEENSNNTKLYYKELDTFKVPTDSYFLLGDNRNESTDARSCFQGALTDYCPRNPDKAYVNIENIRGRAWFVWWPLGNARLLNNPYINSESLDEK